MWYRADGKEAVLIEAGVRRRVGAALMGASLVGAMVLAGPAGAQEEPEEVDLAVEQHAQFSYPPNDVVPDLLLNQFPPQVVCVVEPRLCPESLEPVREPIGGGLQEADSNHEDAPLQPTQPDTVTMSYLGGTPRYAGAARFELPEIPEGEEFDEFTVSFKQTDPSFSYSSPMFRRVVFAFVASAGAQGDPGILQEQLMKALQEEEPIDEPLIGMEACPLTKAMPEDAQPPQSAPIRKVEENRGTEDNPDFRPAVDCLFGANGQFDEKASTWSFDLRSAAKAWADGTLENHGILLIPTGSPNLAFGDPDTSTNAQVVLELVPPPTATVASSEPPPPVQPLGDFPASGGGQPGSGDSGPLQSDVSSPPGGGLDAPPPVEQPEAAPPAEVAPQEPSGPQDQALDTTPVGVPGTDGRIFLLIPVFALGMWLVSRSLTENLAPATARAGALTRLVEGRAGT